MGLLALTLSAQVYLGTDKALVQSSFDWRSLTECASYTFMHSCIIIYFSNLALFLNDYLHLW